MGSEGIMRVTQFFVKRRNIKVVILVVYVNDIVVTRSDVDEIPQLKVVLKKEFETKDLGLLKYFLGTEVARSKTRIVISQKNYTPENRKLGTKSADTPLEQKQSLYNSNGELLQDKRMSQRLVGKSIYLTITRPNISYAVNLISQFMHALRTDHLAAVHRALRYLKASPGQGVL